MHSHESDVVEGVAWVSGEGEVPVECNFAVVEAVSSKHVADGQVGAYHERPVWCFLSGSLVEYPFFSGVVNCEYEFAVPGEGV